MDKNQDPGYTSRIRNTDICSLPDLLGEQQLLNDLVIFEK
jgi:hypothetical protein